MFSCCCGRTCSLVTDCRVSSSIVVSCLLSWEMKFPTAFLTLFILIAIYDFKDVIELAGEVRIGHTYIYLQMYVCRQLISAISSHLYLLPAVIRHYFVYKFQHIPSITEFTLLLAPHLSSAEDLPGRIRRLEERPFCHFAHYLQHGLYRWV